jgi:WD40 repeat protein
MRREKRRQRRVDPRGSSWGHTARQRVAAFVAATIGVTSILVFGLPSAASAEITNPLPRADTWVTNARISAMARQGNDLYVGGEFTRWGPATGHGVLVDPNTGGVTNISPVVDGAVLDAAPDGSGGLYIVGAFNSVNGISRGHGAHLTASGAVTSWDPAASGIIRQIEPIGSNFFIGGDFYTIENVVRPKVAMVDPTVGSPFGWHPTINGPVEALALSPDHLRLFVGGEFTTVGGQSRKNVASVLVSTGAVEAWAPQPNGAVKTIALSPTGSRVYIGGTFTIVGAPRKKLAAVDAITGLLDPTWTADADGAVFSLAVSPNDDVYIGGGFTKVASKSRSNLAAVSTSGALLPWNPIATSAVFGITLPGDGTAWLAGAFGSVRFKPRVFTAHVDLVQGFNVAGADPLLSAPARIIVPMPDGSLFIGGDFTSSGTSVRPYLARIDATTGVLDPTFAPNLDGAVETMDISDDGSTLYIGGLFNTVNGATRHLAGAVSLPSGAVTGFNPNVNGFEVSALDSRGGSVVLGGQFSKVSGVPIANVARVDSITGDPDAAWQPTPNGKVRRLIILSDRSTIIAGDFTKFGLVTNRKYLGLAGPNGGLQPWDPEPTSFVFAGALSPDANTFYAGLGGPGGVGNAVEAFHLSSDHRLWRTEGSGDVQALDLSPDGQTIYAGGHFVEIYATGTTNVIATRNRAMALRASDGGLLPWTPPLDFAGVGVFAVLAKSDALYLGGEFTRIGTQPRQALAFFPGTP